MDHTRRGVPAGGRRVLAAAAACAALLVAYAGFAPALMPRAAAAAAFRVLQMNLCNSGVAGCYEGGQAIGEGIATIRAVAPTVVTLNEICRDDVTRMAQETGRLGVFQPAGNRAGGPYKCVNGQDYGIGILGGTAGDPAPGTEQGLYPEQDGSAEQRAYLCAAFIGFSACTTHLSTDGKTAYAQCRGPAWPLRGKQDQKVVLGGDLNLRYGGDPDVQDCVPAGFFRKGYTTNLGLTRGVQHIMASSAHFAFDRQEVLDMDHTDHPAFVVHLTTAG